jgi:hypothetical protein
MVAQRSGSGVGPTRVELGLGVAELDRHGEGLQREVRGGAVVVGVAGLRGVVAAARFRPVRHGYLQRRVRAQQRAAGRALRVRPGEHGGGLALLHPGPGGGLLGATRHAWVLLLQLLLLRRP